VGDRGDPIYGLGREQLDRFRGQPVEGLRRQHVDGFCRWFVGGGLWVALEAQFDVAKADILAGAKGGFKDLLLVNEAAVGRAEVVKDNRIAGDLDSAMGAGNGRISNGEIVGRAAADEISSGFELNFPGCGRSGIDQKAMHAFRASLNPSHGIYIGSRSGCRSKKGQESESQDEQGEQGGGTESGSLQGSCVCSTPAIISRPRTIREGQ